MPDLSGRSSIVTGANSGLGFQAALQLAGHGSAVILACRSKVKGAAAAARIVERSPDAAVEVMELDLGELASVRRFADSYHNGHGGLDLLVNNAGVMAIPKLTTTDGFETQFGTNHLGHFALTGLLLPALLARPGSRVVTVSSRAAGIGRIRFDDLQGAGYNPWLAYGQSKLANLLFAFELARRVSAAEVDLVSVAAHPGFAATNLQTTGPALRGSRLGVRAAAAANRVFAQSDSQGALPVLYGATAPGVRGGEYFGPDRLFGMRGQPTRVRPPRAARNPETARRLWQVSEQLTGVHFGGVQQSAG